MGIDSAAAESPPPKTYNRNRRTAVSSESVSAEAMENWRPPTYPKTEEERTFLKDVVYNRLGLLFGHLNAEYKDAVVSAMSRREVKNDEEIITQGDMGDYFYIVYSGTFNIFVKRPGKEREKVMVAGKGTSFGELALLYNAPRAATCVWVEDYVVWALDRTSFKMMLVTSENTKKRRYESFLEGIDIFQALNRYERSQLSDILTLQSCAEGEKVISQGETGTRFYIVADGECRCTIKEADGPELEVARYKSGGYFGELALICDGPRKASVYADGPKVDVLWIDKNTFDRVLGPIIDILKANAELYPTYQDILAKSGNS